MSLKRICVRNEMLKCPKIPHCPKIPVVTLITNLLIVEGSLIATLEICIFRFTQ